MRIGWILGGTRSSASSRIEGYNLHDWLISKGHESDIIYVSREGSVNLPFVPPIFKKYDVIIFQKVYGDMANLAIQIYKNQGIKTIFYITDLVDDMGKTLYWSDRSIMSSPYMINKIQSKYQDKIVLLKDSYESPRDFKKEIYKSDKVKVLWFGTLRTFELAESFRPLMEGLKYDFITISSTTKATKRWDEKEIFEDIKNSDVVIIPSPLDEFAKSKDENRLVQSMVIGVPCVVSPVPAYVELHNRFNPEPCFIANDKVDWFNYLKALGKEELREEVGKWGRECVVDEYNIENIGRKFLDILWKEINYVKR